MELSVQNVFGLVIRSRLLSALQKRTCCNPVAPLIRELERTVDPLFRWAGIRLDAS